ncbi:hypothetical protein AALB16_03455 [Lachnospiraceae bacterium 62-35]
MNHTAQNQLEELASVIRDLTDTANRISHSEEAKAEAASQNRHELLDGFIQEEQAYILKLRGLEQRRLRLLESLGWKSLTFRQVLEQADPSQKELLSPLFFELETQLKRLENARKASEQIIGVRLHELQISIAKAQGSSYDNSGNVNLNAPSHAKLRDKYV